MSLTEIKELKCGKCGGELKGNGKVYQCVYCHAEFAVDNVEKEKQALAALLDEQKQEQLANLRRLLWAEIHEEYIDSEKIAGICAEIRKIVPEDFAASFFEIANSGGEAQVNGFLRKVDFSDATQKIWAEEMVKFMLKSLRAKNLLAVQCLIEKAFRDCDLQKYEKYSTAFSREAERVNGGVYEPSLPRDVFVAYSSKDMEKVEELVETLEERGLTCFVAARNLQHGRGATANYEQSLEKAMSACKTVIFVSSKFSRSMACEAVRLELPYIMEKDKQNAPYEYRQRYDKMPIKYKKPRVEYRLDNAKSAENSIVKEFFGTLEYAYSKEEVASRIEKYLTETVIETPKEKEGKVEKANRDFARSLGGEMPRKEEKKSEIEEKYQALYDDLSRIKEEQLEKERKAEEPIKKQSKVSGEFRRDGNYAYFGLYPQSEGSPKTIGELDENGYFDGGDGYRYAKENGKYYKVEPIKWRILSEEKGKMLLLSEKILDAGAKESYTEKSVVRNFLNVKFLKKAFSETDRLKILPTEAENAFGEPTQDKIFLLSKEELMNPNYGFMKVESSDEDRMKTRTNYAFKNEDENGVWLTRSAELRSSEINGVNIWKPVLVKRSGDFSIDYSVEVFMSGNLGAKPYGYVPALYVKVGAKKKKEPPVVEDKAKNESVSKKTELTKGVLREGNYIWFGEYPQSKKAASVTVYDRADKDGYFAASDGCRYKKAENGKHYKVEPIKWRILYQDGKTFKLLSDKILGYSWRDCSSVDGDYVGKDLQKVFDGLVEGVNGLRVRVRKPYNGFLEVNEIKERLSLLQRIRKPTAFAQSNGCSTKSWWADYENVVTAFGAIKKCEKHISSYIAGLTFTATNTYGIVPCIIIEILE